MKKIYDKNYSNQDLTIPATVWNDKSINGIQKMMLPLFSRLTKDGTSKTKFLSRITAQILCTHEKDVLYNVKELVKKGYIKLEKIDGDIWLSYTYQSKAPQVQSSNSLFE
jgi:hypothetical protein